MAGRLLCVGLLLAVVTTQVIALSESEGALSLVDAPDAQQAQQEGAKEEVAQEESGREGAFYWRVIAETPVPLEGWVLSKIQFFTTQDGSGAPAGKFCGAGADEAIAKSFRGMSDLDPPAKFKTCNAFDGTDDSSWESEDGTKGQWIGAKFAEKQDIQALVLRTPDSVKGPSGVTIQKSDDGETWARVAEITDMRDWGKKDQLFKLVPMDRLPPSVFAIRSQKDPAFCVGVKTRKQIPDDDDSPIIDIEEGAVLELQKCMDDVVTQWWSFDVNRGILHNAKDTAYIAGPAEGAQAGAALVIKKCLNGCPDEKASEFMYSDSVNGGFMRGRTAGNLVFGPKDKEMAESTPVVLNTCGEEGAVASLKVCETEKEAQFELLPMFALEPGKEAIKCSPYSHSLVLPSEADSRQEAQRLCAADVKCSAYSWAKGNAADMQNKVFLCAKLHDVHSGVEGWEMGVRAGRAYDSPYEEEFF